ncbi:conserved Plasmodium protein, unknown function [Plasmodium malariae]|uniref:DNA/RNA-binding protein Alba-like domain-containing protein n=1 Tax=Plasmodium malariae TaxID=5858 RepID=A0A1C3KEB8_PLAMA|nr:conserved Plasmodium protein, unknown function [Plasmodium malariae]
MKEKECYEIVLNTKSGNFQKYIDHCMEKVKLGNVKIVGRQYAITKAFNVLEVLKNKVMELEHYITYKNLRVIIKEDDHNYYMLYILIHIFTYINTHSYLYLHT